MPTSADALFASSKQINHSMNIWLLSTDYFFSSQLQGDLQRLGVVLHQVATSDLLLEKVKANDAESFVLIDLTLPELSFEIVSQLKTIDRPPKAIIAYGPHVAEGKLAAAKAAGCDQVLTRGQAHREMPTVLGKYL